MGLKSRRCGKAGVLASAEAAGQRWVTERMRELEPLADGIQLADENLRARPFRFLAPANLAAIRLVNQAVDLVVGERIGRGPVEDAGAVL